MDRPIGVYILTALAVLAAVLNAIVTLRFLGILPLGGPLELRIFNFWYALLYGLLVWVWAWVAKMLWDLDRSAWTFLAIISVFTLSMDFFILVTGGSWYDVNVSVIVSALVLIYIMLPGVREAFGTD